MWIHVMERPYHDSLRAWEKTLQREGKLQEKMSNVQEMGLKTKGGAKSRIFKNFERHELLFTGDGQVVCDICQRALDL